jgi:hypothetical protein
MSFRTGEGLTRLRRERHKEVSFILLGLLPRPLHIRIVAQQSLSQKKTTIYLNL